MVTGLNPVIDNLCSALGVDYVCVSLANQLATISADTVRKWALVVVFFLLKCCLKIIKKRQILFIECHMWHSSSGRLILISEKIAIFAKKSLFYNGVRHRFSGFYV